MLLPNADRAEIDPEKLRSYLLSSEHPLGRFKARFFTALGFSAERWEELESALRTQHLTQEAEPVTTEAAVHGQKFTIRVSSVGQAVNLRWWSASGSFARARTCHDS